jgi:hypothetical protein
MRVVLAASAGFTGYRFLLASGTSSTFFDRCPETWGDP